MILNKHSIAIIALILGIGVWSSHAGENYNLNTILYGASYYHEYMPYERLEQDVQLMQKAGITVVRLGESTWSLWEPRDGEFEFAWMDRVIDRLHKAGIKVILGTPTYSVPPWMYHKHPEIYRKLSVNGEPTPYGMRQEANLSNPAFRFYCERVIRQIVNHYKDHPAIIGYQVDNETHTGFNGRDNYLNFLDYLKEKYGTVEKINQIWGLNYWGQTINSFAELAPRDGMVNPGYKLDWERFQHKITTDFLAWQAGIVREYKRPDQFICHNFVGGLRTDVNQYDIAQTLDVVAVNPYTPVQDGQNGEDIAWSGDINRSLKRNNYLVTETNAQTIGWSSDGQFPPYDGQLRQNVYTHLASGANCVLYWHWHSLHYGQETYWKGVLSHDLQPNRIYREMSRTGAELQRIGANLVNLKKTNKVAILFSLDSYHGLKYMPFDRQVDYQTIMRQFYSVLYQLNVETDIVYPQSDNFSDYDLILVPPLYIASDEVLNKLTAFVDKGGRLLLSFKSGFCNEYSTVRWEMAPGPLRKAAGISYQEFSTLREPLPLQGDPWQLGDKNRVSVWAELLIAETAQPLAYYDHPFLGQFPAITRNNYGKGVVYYQGALLADELQRAVMKDILASANLTGPDQDLPLGIIVKKGVNAQGKTLRYYFNFTDRENTFTYPYTEGKELLQQTRIEKNSSITLKPWDVAIILAD
ncbi:MAG TPA: beta-galactosidase [bacterium]|nr:beta-galactosidase [bacterium]HPN44073.1 beta-galactosidase [bacterium]